MRLKTLYLCILMIPQVLSAQGDRDSLVSLLNSELTAQDRITVLVKLTQFDRYESREKTKTYVLEAIELASLVKDDESIMASKRSLAVMYYQLGNYDSAQMVINEILKLPNRKNYSKLLGMTYKLRGNISVKQGYSDEAINDYRYALELFENAGLAREIAVLNVSMSNYFRRMGNDKAALDYNLKALNIFDSLGEKRTIAIISNNLGVFYKNQADFQKAESYYLKAIELNSQLGNKSGLSSCYNNLGNVYLVQEKWEQSLRYHNLAYEIRKEMGDTRGLADSHLNRGEVYLGLKHPDQAILNFTNAYKIYTEIEDHGGMSYYYLDMGKAHRQLGNLSRSKDFLYRCVSKSEEIEYPKNVLIATKMLSELEEELGNFDKAYHLLLKNKELSDSLLNETNAKEIARLESQYEYEKKEQILIANQKEANLVYEGTLREERTFRYVVIAVAVMLLFVTLGAYNVSRVIRVKNGKLETANQELSENREVLEEQKEALSVALDEKDLLMREIQHRTKNNFLIIQNLLSAQLQNSEDEKVKYSLGTIYHRLESVRLIHEIFYENDQNFEFVSLRYYLEKLSHRIYESFCEGDKIVLKTEIANVDINKDVIIPLGLIANEVLTNSFKYAFPQKKDDCQINIASKYTSEHLILSISDNGIGFDLECRSHNSMGMRIIEGLSSQLSATYRFIKENGTRFQIEIPLDSLKVQ